MRTLVRRDLGDEDAATYRWTDFELERHIQHAVRELSLFRPVQATAMLSAAAGSRDLALGGIAGLIGVEAVEYPMGRRPPSYVRFSVWADALTILEGGPADDGDAARLLYTKLHTLDAASSSLPVYLEEVVAMGAGGYAALEWASFATNRVNVGGADTWRNYLSWGQERLAMFQRALTKLAVNNSVRARRLYAAAASAGEPVHGLGAVDNMRSLSPTLLAAQQSASGVPHVRVEVRDMLAGVARPSPERVYTGSEDGRHHAAVMAGDGALVRARERASDRGLYVQRVAAPGVGSDFSAWTRLDYASLECNVALCAHGATVLLFFVDNYDGRTIYVRESGDNGATWGAGQTVVVPSGDGVRWLAAAFNASGTAALFYAASDSRVYVKKRAGPRWSTSLTWTNDLSGVTGLACVYTRDWDLAVAGADPAGGPGLWTCIHGDGGEQASDTWSALRAIGRAQEDSDVEFHTPFLSSPDVTRLSYVEKYSGVTPSKRIHLLHTLPGTSFAQDLWRDPVPFDLETEHGLALASDSGTLWLSHPTGVWRGTLAGGPLDVSRDVLELSSREGAEGGQVTMVLTQRRRALRPPRRGRAGGYAPGLGGPREPGLRHAPRDRGVFGGRLLGLGLGAPLAGRAGDAHALRRRRLGDPGGLARAAAALLGLRREQRPGHSGLHPEPGGLHAERAGRERHD